MLQLGPLSIPLLPTSMWALERMLPMLGIALCLSGILYFALAGRASGSRIPWAEYAIGLARGLLAGIALGLIAAFAFNYVQSLDGLTSLQPPDSLREGLLDGLICGGILGFAAIQLWRLPRRLLIGAGTGLALAVALFRAIFGPTAGYGNFTDDNVTIDVGLLFGLLGCLVGGVLAVGIAPPISQAEPGGVGAHAAHNARHPMLLWAGSGLILGVVVGLLGWRLQLFQLLLPYYGGITDAQPEISQEAVVAGIVYGVALFGVVGALLGGFIGGLRSRTLGASSAAGPQPSHSCLVLGVATGLTAGFDYRASGGPRPVSRVIVDPVGGTWGLLLGAAIGIAVGLLVALLLALAARYPARSRVTLGMALLLSGLLIVLFPAWYVAPFVVYF
jgi:hypothetical protein